MNFLIICFITLVVLCIFNLVFVGRSQGTWGSSADYLESFLLKKTPVKFNHTSESTESKGEYICKKEIENIFKKPFIKTRSYFMHNTVTGKPLELDIYNKELGVAVEYNGKQHYEYIPYFHKNKESFQTQQYRDLMKRDLCRRYGIDLIVVSYKEKNIREAIMKPIKENPNLKKKYDMIKN